MIAEKSNVFGALTPKEIVSNNPLIGLFASTACKVIRINVILIDIIKYNLIRISICECLFEYLLNSSYIYKSNDSN